MTAWATARLLRGELLAGMADRVLAGGADGPVAAVDDLDGRAAHRAYLAVGSHPSRSDRVERSHRLERDLPVDVSPAHPVIPADVLVSGHSGELLPRRAER